jgi:histone H3/H4
MRNLIIACGVALAMPSGTAFAEAAATPVAAPTTAYSSSTTPMGVLLNNPATKAVLVKVLPEFIDKMSENMDRVSGMTLKEIQDSLKAYAPDVLSDAKLAAIDVDLAKIPVTN